MKSIGLALCILSALLVALVVVADGKKASKEDGDELITTKTDVGDGEDGLEVEVANSTTKPVKLLIATDKQHKKKKTTTSEIEVEDTSESSDGDSDEPESGSRCSSAVCIRKVPRWGR